MAIADNNATEKRKPSRCTLMIASRFSTAFATLIQAQ
jgi:hypothetical protein